MERVDRGVGHHAVAFDVNLNCGGQLAGKCLDFLVFMIERSDRAAPGGHSFFSQHAEESLLFRAMILIPIDTQKFNNALKNISRNLCLFFLKLRRMRHMR